MITQADNPLDMLSEKFAGRGLAGSVLAENAELSRREIRDRLSNPLGAICEDIMTSDRDNYYRTGRNDNSTYMTVDDAKRLLGDVYCTPVFNALKDVSTETGVKTIDSTARPAAAYSLYSVRGVKEKRSADEEGIREDKGYRDDIYVGGVISPNGNVTGNLGTEMNIKRYNHVSLINRIKHTFFGKEPVLTVNAGNPSVVPALIYAFIMIFFLAALMYFAVLSASEKNTIAKLDSQIILLEEHKRNLEIELEEKNNFFELHSLAANEYNMIEIDKSYYTLLNLHSNDSVENIINDNHIVMPPLPNLIDLFEDG